MSGNGLPTVCINNYPNLSSPVGFGLAPETINGLNFIQYPNAASPQDVAALGHAFMLDDNGNGQVDPNAGGIACSAGSTSAYCSCVSEVNTLLATGTESHACAEYIASSPASSPGDVQSGDSGPKDEDYSLKFVDCNSIEPRKQAPQSNGP
jgi:hypothetical protein